MQSKVEFSLLLASLELRIVNDSNNEVTVDQVESSVTPVQPVALPLTGTFFFYYL